VESLTLSRLRIRRLEWDPYIGFAILE